MIILLIYNNETHKFERYCLEPFDPMPYIRGNTLTVKEFLTGSFSSVAWTTTGFLNALSDLLKSHNVQISRAFRRIREGGHIAESCHYAGTAVDFAGNITPLCRLKMYDSLKNKNTFTYFDDLNKTVGFIHADTRSVPRYGYPALSPGESGVHVLVLQDALNTLGITGSGLDGFFGPLTLESVKRFQAAAGLPTSGVADRETWRRLANAAAGAGLPSDCPQTVFI